MNLKLAAVAALLLAGAAPAKLDPDTAAWWATTAQLSNDAMEGRDTGSSAYLRAANMVASKFAAAGLKPAGENGTWFQRVPMHELAVARAAFRVGNRPLVFLHDLTISPTEGMPRRIDAPLAYGGYCGAASLNDVRGKVVICHGTHRAGLPSAAQREAAVRAAGAAGMLTIADPGFTVEPPRWPYAYARTVTLASDPQEDRSVRSHDLERGFIRQAARGERQERRGADRRRKRGAPATELRGSHALAGRPHHP